MGYAFASHFSPAPAAPALEAYRGAFVPSEAFPEPHAILAVAALCAETAERAEHLAATLDLVWLRLQRGELRPLPTPEEALAHPYTPADREALAERRALVIVGPPQQVREQIEARASEAGADEVMVTTLVHDHGDRLRSYELLMGEAVHA